MTEWRSPPGYEGEYEVSDDGQVRSLKTRTSAVAGKVLSQSLHADGRLFVTLTKDGKWKPVAVHRLVCGAFHGPAPFPRAHACHGDGEPLNNRQENLRWATAKENHADRDRHGRTARGERQGLSKLKTSEVKMIINSSLSAKELASFFGISTTLVYNIRKRKVWKHVGTQQALAQRP